MAHHRHKRETNARRAPRASLVAAPIAVVATVSAVSWGVLSAAPVNTTQDLLASSSSASLGAATSSELLDREPVVSRSQPRTGPTKKEKAAERRAERKKRAAKRAKVERVATRRAVNNADTKLWTTTDLNLWTESGKDAKKVGLLDAIEKVLVTGRRENGRAEVVLGGKSRWVTADYLVQEKPETGPSLGGQCTNGSSVDAGRATIYDIHDAVCANWPQITSYGTWRGDGEHGQGRAVDIMVSGSTGWEVAEFLRANSSAFGIEYLIYSQKIWSVERSGEGWRGMSDRGSVTANHYDHVHVTVY